MLVIRNQYHACADTNIIRRGVRNKVKLLSKSWWRRLVSSPNSNVQQSLIRVEENYPNLVRNIRRPSIFRRIGIRPVEAGNVIRQPSEILNTQTNLTNNITTTPQTVLESINTMDRDLLAVERRALGEALSGELNLNQTGDNAYALTRRACREVVNLNYLLHEAQTVDVFITVFIRLLGAVHNVNPFMPRNIGHLIRIRGLETVHGNSVLFIFFFAYILNILNRYLVRKGLLLFFLLYC